MEYLLPRGVRYIIDTLGERGYRADVVGGAVRDMYLGRELSDFDITTNALPETVKRIFADLRTVDTGIRHGTVTLLLDGESYEVTTYRRDGEYLDSRHPESVEFTGSLEEDVLRRDFTMNALCYNGHDGITDLVGGLEDIDRRIIRTVGEPRVRFSEDALRILRALRFSATLGFAIEEKTASAIHALSSSLGGISSERIYSEWQKLINGDFAYTVIQEFRDVISQFLPAVSLRLPKREEFDRASGFVRMLSLFAMGADMPSEDFGRAMRELKSDRAARELGERALELLFIGLPRDERKMLRALSRFGREACELAFEVGATVGVCTVDAGRLVDRAVASGIPYSVRELAIDGTDLLARGLRGAEIGKALEGLLRLVMNGECKNEREDLLRHL